MPNYWIICLSEDNLIISLEHQMIAMGEHRKKVMEQMEIDDMIVFYVAKKAVDSPKNDKTQEVRSFRGIAKIIGPMFESNDIIWKVKSGELFPYRRKVEFLNTDLNVSIKPLIDKLSFIENTAYWGVAFQRGYTKITEQDFKIIKKAGSL